ncbi:MAG: WD40/YVTN/BNR-like repeat-containing protein, partial [Gammaproteobacteria bacterium]
MPKKLERSLALAFVVIVASATCQGRALASPIPNPLAHLDFRNLGPAVAGGRVTSVVGIAGNPNLYYVGAAAGGVWKTTDGGNAWNNVFSHGDSASIGAIALAPSNPNLVWVGTGEANPRNDMVDGGGVYYSPDAGKSWRFMGLRDAGQIGRIVIDPADPKVVYVCALGDVWKPNEQRGVFMSTDGGGHWKKVLYVNDQTGCSSLAMQPGNPQVLIAGMWQLRRYPWVLDSGGPGSGLYRSTDGGLTWHKLSDGLPVAPTGRSAVAFAPSRPDQVYALIQAKRGVLWASDDMGSRWHRVSDDQDDDVRPFYFTQLAVAPNDPERLFMLSMKMMESKDGGKTSFYADAGVHVDHHAIWIDPRNPERIIQGNDGGVYLSNDGAKTWRYLDNLPIEEFYQVATGDTVPFLICGGIQDNGAWCGLSSDVNQHQTTGREWFMVAGGDGQYVVPAPSDPEIIYADTEDGDIVRFNRRDNQSQPIFASKNVFGGLTFSKPLSQQRYRFNWTSPIAVSYTDPNAVYLGANVVFRSVDGGTHWQVISPDLTRNDKAKQQLTGGLVDYDLSGAENYDTIQSISLSRVDGKVIWVGTDDGLVWVTRDQGGHWEKVTPP